MWSPPPIPLCRGRGFRPVGGPGPLEVPGAAHQPAKEGDYGGCPGGQRGTGGGKGEGAPPPSPPEGRPPAHRLRRGRGGDQGPGVGVDPQRPSCNISGLRPRYPRVDDSNPWALAGSGKLWLKRKAEKVAYFFGRSLWGVAHFPGSSPSQDSGSLLGKFLVSPTSPQGSNKKRWSVGSATLPADDGAYGNFKCRDFR